MLDPYNPEGSTAAVSLTTTSSDRYAPRPDRSHVNWIVLDSGWEAQLAHVIEDHPRVLAYAKNHNLHFEVPYLHEAEPRRYLPDYLVKLDGGTTLLAGRCCRWRLRSFRAEAGLGFGPRWPGRRRRP